MILDANFPAWFKEDPSTGHFMLRNGKDHLISLLLVMILLFSGACGVSGSDLECISHMHPHRKWIKKRRNYKSQPGWTNSPTHFMEPTSPPDECMVDCGLEWLLYCWLHVAWIFNFIRWPWPIKLRICKMNRGTLKCTEVESQMNPNFCPTSDPTIRFWGPSIYGYNHQILLIFYFQFRCSVSSR